MEAAGGPALSSPNPPQAKHRKAGGRRWPWGPRRNAAHPQGEAPLDPLLTAGRTLRQQREARGLSLRQLAMETRISTAVLEALERGWRERLPEPTYLRTMLPLIERQLELEPGTLRALLPASPPSGRRLGAAGGGPGFDLRSIDLFNGWQGTALYGVLMLLLIHLLNLEQQRLATAGLLQISPLTINNCSESRPSPPTGPAAEPGHALLRQHHPELRPLEQAAGGQALRLWRRASSP
jgi:hypothetical protein